jgi:hypothetical protein
MLYVILPAYVVAYILMCILTLYEVLGENTLYIINSYINISTPILSMIYYIFLLVKFSGRPYISETLKLQVFNILRVVMVWCVARLVNVINLDNWNFGCNFCE